MIKSILIYKNIIHTIIYKMKELLSVITLCISYAWGQAYHSPPNILFIMADDHAAKAVSSYNDNLIHTPNIDRIGKEGARFTQAFATNAGITLHMNCPYWENLHHIVEALFKSFARALDIACSLDNRTDQVPSTKGKL